MDELPFLCVVAMALRAGRRAKGLNQRDFAQLAGLSSSTVARLEASRGDVGLGPLRTALAMVGLRLAVVHDDGRPFVATSALPLDEAGVVDRAGRRFPAHLPEDLYLDDHYWRTWRDEQAGVTDRGPWTYRRWIPGSAESWQRWNAELWGPGEGNKGAGPGNQGAGPGNQGAGPDREEGRGGAAESAF
jgi:transcriptional regulator with XRE-family HTH domain